MDHMEELETAERHLQQALVAFQEGRWMDCCRSLGVMQNHVVEVVPWVAQHAFLNEKAKKKDIATALGVPPAYLRGLERW